MENIKVQKRVNVKQFIDEDITASLSVSIEREEEDYCIVEHAGESFGIGLANLKILRDLINTAIDKFEKKVSMVTTTENAIDKGNGFFDTISPKIEKEKPAPILLSPDMIGVEQVKELKDGRLIWKTHNGFKFWLKDKKGKITEVTEEYYNKAKVHAV
jgi:hypothetical protein